MLPNEVVSPLTDTERVEVAEIEKVEQKIEDMIGETIAKLKEKLEEKDYAIEVLNERIKELEVGYVAIHADLLKLIGAENTEE